MQTTVRSAQFDVGGLLFIQLMVIRFIYRPISTPKWATYFTTYFSINQLLIVSVLVRLVLILCCRYYVYYTYTVYLTQINCMSLTQFTWVQDNDLQVISVKRRGSFKSSIMFSLCVSYSICAGQAAGLVRPTYKLSRPRTYISVVLLSLYRLNEQTNYTSDITYTYYQN